MRRAAVVASALVLFALGAMLAVFVAGSASAASPKTTTTKSTSKKTTATKSKAAPSTVPTPTYTTTTTESPGDSFFVINGTVNAASDHEIVGSSAFPNFTKGAVDNYYSMAHSHVDNSPFAEGTASPADTGPIGQTAAAGNTQQPQYADARWPGDSASGKATYGTQGQPYAEATAGEYKATADASEATNGLSGPGLGGKRTLALPVGFDGRLRQALAGWKTKWQDLLGLKKAVSPQKPIPTVTTPVGTVTVPKVPVTVPKAGVTTPVATVSTPTPPAVGASPAPPVTVPSPTPTLPSAGAQSASRSLAARPLARPAVPASPSASSSTPGDGESLLTSSTRAFLVETAARKTVTTTTGTTTTGTTTTKTAKTKTTKTKTTKTKTAKSGMTTTGTITTGTTKTDKPKKNYALVTSGESSLGRVSLGGGQIVIEGIHVTASITNDGTPSYKAAVSVASATIGGVPVTIDQDGVHVAGQGQGLPYQQASDGLNGALKQAGIQLFLVGPEVTTGSCGQPGTGTGTGGGSNSSTTSTTSGQSGAQSSCSGQAGGMCGQSGAGNGTGGGPPLPGSTTSTDQSGAPSPCGGQAGGVCGQSGDGSGGGTGGAPGLPGSTTTSTNRSATSTTPSSCDQTCNQTAAGSGTGTGSGSTTTATTSRTATTPTPSRTTTTTSSNQSGATTSSSCGGTGLPSTTGSCASTGTGTGTTPTSSTQAGETTPTSSGDQFGFGAGTSNASEMTVTATGVHVVFTQPVNQSGVPAQYIEHILGEVFVDSLATPATPAGNLPDLGFSSSSSSSFSSSCLGGRHSGGAKSGLSAAGGSSSAGGSNSSSGFASSQPTSNSTGSPLGHAMAGVASMLRTKPLWVLVAFLVWQALAIGTSASLWYWRKGGAS